MKQTHFFAYIKETDMSKLTVAVIFGGQSSEHIVSCMSAVNVIEHIDSTRYNIVLVGITEEGHWIKTESLEDVKSGAWRDGKVWAVLPPDATKKCILLMDGDNVEEVKVDIVFPILHGLYGEDGTIQGLLELARIPYVGCGVLASAVSMDKLYTKIIVSDLGIRQAEYESVYREELGDMEQVRPGLRSISLTPCSSSRPTQVPPGESARLGTGRNWRQGFWKQPAMTGRSWWKKPLWAGRLSVRYSAVAATGLKPQAWEKSWQPRSFMILTPSILMRSPGRSRTPCFRMGPHKRYAGRPWTYSGQWTDTVWPGWIFL